MDPKPSKKMLTLPRFDSISDEWNESGNESWESGWMTVSAHHHPPHRFRFHIKNSCLSEVDWSFRPGGGHSVWSTCSPSSLSRTWAPWSSRPSAGLPLGPPGREMVNGGGRLIRWKWQQQKIWWFMVMDEERLWKMYKRRARSREPGTLGSTQAPASPPPRRALAIGIATTLGR